MGTQFKFYLHGIILGGRCPPYPLPKGHCPFGILRLILIFPIKGYINMRRTQKNIFQWQRFKKITPLNYCYTDKIELRDL